MQLRQPFAQDKYILALGNKVFNGHLSYCHFHIYQN